MDNKYFPKNGFTLIEVVVTIAIFTVLIFGVATILNDIFIKSNQQLTALSNIDQARSALNTFTNEIRDAVIGSDGSYPIIEAGDYEIIFFSNYKVSNGKIARVRYYISNGTLYKGTTLPTGSPPSYNLSSETITSIASGIANGSSPIFYYYDGSYDGTSNNFIAQPININQIRYVKINLSVLNNMTPQSNSTFSVTAGATVRSLKDNLGN